MPTYEYKCLECDKVFEEFQSMTAAPLENCKFCDGKVKRLIGAGAGIIFKGSGFYCTDYKNSSTSGTEAKTEKKETSNSSTTSSESTAKTEKSAK